MRAPLAVLAPALALALALPALATAAAALPACGGGPAAEVCLSLWPGYLAVGARTAGGQAAEASYAQGTGFAGDYLYVILIAEQQGLLRVHGGVGFADRNYDHLYEDACVCGAVQSFFYLPFGVGVEDLDGDGLPDSFFYEPQLGL